MPKLEISVLINDNKIYKLDGEELDVYEEKFAKDFAKTIVGKSLKREGYKLVERDFDDETLQLFYRKK